MSKLAASNFIWRLKERCLRTRFAPLKRWRIFMYEVCQYFSGSGIAWESRFANQPCLPHGVKGVFVSRAARVGRNCVIFHQVTIGSNSLPDSDKLGAPRVGDHCYIGAGAKIIGGIIIGNNVRIGANCVVAESVPDNTLVVAGKPVIIQREKLANRFYAWHDQWVYFEDGRWLAETDAAVIARLNAGLGADDKPPAER
jgi:serine O-acetyltransferase